MKDIHKKLRGSANYGPTVYVISNTIFLQVYVMTRPTRQRQSDQGGRLVIQVVLNLTISIRYNNKFACAYDTKNTSTLFS